MIAWLALVLAVLELVLLVAVVAFAARAWQRVKPSLSPFLSMLAPYTATSSTSSSSSSSSPADHSPLPAAGELELDDTP